MMNKVSLYSQEMFNPEADMIYICSCDSKDMASYIKNALEHYDNYANNYYIKG